mmetsp:Transcript_58663/g.143467  ORF Transcript_58663/g.143467 Transcript_58663/m.143467 type:complete len:683 (+) Transcript_58663:179-2227(+)
MPSSPSNSSSPTTPPRKHGSGGEVCDHGDGSGSLGVGGSNHSSPKTVPTAATPSSVLTSSKKTTAASATPGPNNNRTAAGASQRKTMAINSGNVDEVSKKVGFIVDEFKCQHNNFSGILYCGPLGIVFLGRFLLFEWTVSIKWEDVIHVNQVQNRKGNDVDIQIETRSSLPVGKSPGGSKANAGTQVYLFERFFDVSKALNTLVSLHNDSMLDVKTTPTPRQVSRGLRRMNSDPLRISNLFNFEDMPSVLADKDDEATTTMKDFYKEANSTTGASSSLVNASSKAILSDPNPSIVRASAKKNYHKSATYTFSDQTSDGRQLRFEEPNGQNETSSAGTESGHSIDINGAVDIGIEWKKTLTEVGKMKEIVVEDYRLSGCDMEQFVSYFVNDDAPHSIPNYMKQNGDDEVTVTSWIKDDGLKSSSETTDELIAKSVFPPNDSSNKTRTIEYIHPVNAPMAPPTAGARKEQKLKRFGDHGLIIETKTFVSDVPMTDCFYLCDVIRVEPILEDSATTTTGNGKTKNEITDESKKDGQKSTTTTSPSSSGVIINIHCDIRFVKSTMFQSLITKTSKSEFKSFSDSMIDFMTRSIKTEKGIKDDLDDAEIEKERARRRSSIQQMTTTAPSNTMTTYGIMGMLIFVIILQIWIISSMRQTKSEMHDIMEAVAAMRNENQQHVCRSTSSD